MAKQRTRPWYAQASGLFNNPKLFELDGEEIAVWVWLLCTCKQDELGGRIPPAYINVDFIKYSARIKTVEAVQHTLDVIVKQDCASYDDEGFLVIKNWEKYQKSPSDKPEEVNKRVKLHRKNKKQEETGCNEQGEDETEQDNLQQNVTSCNELKRDETTTVQYNTVHDIKNNPPNPPSQGGTSPSAREDEIDMWVAEQSRTYLGREISTQLSQAQGDIFWSTVDRFPIGQYEEKWSEAWAHVGAKTKTTARTDNEAKHRMIKVCNRMMRGVGARASPKSAQSSTDYLKNLAARKAKEDAERAKLSPTQ